MFLFVFLPILLGVYAIGSLRTRNTTLALTSIIFYAWDYFAYAGILCVSIAFNYLVGIGVAGDRPARVRRLTLILGIVGNLALLGCFKYAGFFVENFNQLLLIFDLTPLAVPAVNMPLGISFFTFQAISYVVDVHRRQVSPQRNPLDLSLFIALFPQLIAGPIVRYHEIVGQIYARTISSRTFSIGVRRFIIGLAKKLLIADTLAGPAHIVFGLSLEELTTPLAWIGLVCFTLQIYFDFSGYSDMAIGLGKMFGFRIPENFNHPYAARSVTEFWRRWHMTLSRWFRDYLYIPLGGNRHSPIRTYANLFAVFLLCGFWHGASWNFLLWGFLHGAFLTIERMGFLKYLERLPAIVGSLYMLLSVMLGWVFFQCPSLDQAFGFLSVMFGQDFGGQTFYEACDLCTTDVGTALLIGTLAAGGFFTWIRVTVLAHFLRPLKRSEKRQRATLLRTSGHLMYLFLFVICCIRISASTYTPFLYFRF